MVKRHVVHRPGAAEAKPARRPIERAQKNEGVELGISVAQLAPPLPGGDDGSDRALVAIALMHHLLEERRRQIVKLQVKHTGGLLAEKHPQMAFDEMSNLAAAAVLLAGRLGHCQERIECAILAVVDELVLVAKVVVQVAGREAERLGDLAHPRPPNAQTAKGVGGAEQDLALLGVGACLF